MIKTAKTGKNEKIRYIPYMSNFLCHKIYRVEAVGLNKFQLHLNIYDFLWKCEIWAILWKFDILSITA